MLITLLRHSLITAKPGSTTISTVVSDLGTVLSPSFASQSLILIPTCTSSVAISTAVKISSEPGVPGRPISTAYRWKVPLASENAGTNPTNRFPLVTFQRNQTLFTFSWFSSLPRSFSCFFSLRCLLTTLSHPRHAFRSNFRSLALLYVYTKYVSCLPLRCFFFLS